MNPNQLTPVKLTVASTALSTDGTAVVVTFNPPPTQSFTQAQLYSQLAQQQSQLANAQNLVNTISTNIANIQAQLALFPAQTTTTTTTTAPTT